MTVLKPVRIGDQPSAGQQNELIRRVNQMQGGPDFFVGTDVAVARKTKSGTNWPRMGKTVFDEFNEYPQIGRFVPFAFVSEMTTPTANGLIEFAIPEGAIDGNVYGINNWLPVDSIISIFKQDVFFFSPTIGHDRCIGCLAETLNKTDFTVLVNNLQPIQGIKPTATSVIVVNDLELEGDFGSTAYIQFHEFDKAWHLYGIRPSSVELSSNALTTSFIET